MTLNDPAAASSSKYVAYQVSDKYLPDKEGTWKYPKTCDGWFHSHNAFRGEVTAIRSAVQATASRGAVPLQSWEVTALHSVLTIHIEHMRNDRRVNEDVFLAEYAKRFRFPNELFQPLEDNVFHKLSEVEACSKKLKAGDVLQRADDDTDGTGLWSVWDHYEQSLRSYLLELEDIAMPLMRAYFTPKDVAPLASKLVSKSTKTDLSSFFYYMGEERLRNEFMKQEGIPFFVWHVDFQYKFRHFEKVFVDPIRSLIVSGMPPPPPTTTTASS